MKKIMYSLLAIVFVLTIFAGTTMAGWTRPSADTDASGYAVQTVANTTVDLTQDPLYIFGGTIPNSSIITVTLAGGATFAEALVDADLIFSDVSAGGGTVSLIGAPAAGDTSFQVLLSGADIAISDNLAIGDGSGQLTLNLSAVTGAASQTMSIAAENQSATYSWLSSTARTIVEAGNVAETTTTGNTDASTTTVIDVAQDKTELLLTDGVTNATASAAGTYKVTNTLVGVGADDIAIAKLLYTISGDMTAVSTITATGVTGSTSAGVQTGGTANTFTIDATNNVAYASNTAALADNASLNLNDLIVTFDGTTEIAESSYTITGEVLADNFSAYDISSFAFLTLAYNGSTRTAHQITVPTASNATIIRVYNPTARSADVIGTLYGEDGSIIGTADTTIATALAAQALVKITAQDIEDAFGTWTGRARLKITANLTDMEVTVQLKTNGTVTNWSGVCPN